MEEEFTEESPNSGVYLSTEMGGSLNCQVTEEKEVAAAILEGMDQLPSIEDVDKEKVSSYENEFTQGDYLSTASNSWSAFQPMGIVSMPPGLAQSKFNSFSQFVDYGEQSRVDLNFGDQAEFDFDEVYDQFCRNTTSLCGSDDIISGDQSINLQTYSADYEFPAPTLSNLLNNSQLFISRDANLDRDNDLIEQAATASLTPILLDSLDASKVLAFEQYILTSTSSKGGSNVESPEATRLRNFSISPNVLLILEGGFLSSRYPNAAAWANWDNITFFNRLKEMYGIENGSALPTQSDTSSSTNSSNSPSTSALRYSLFNCEKKMSAILLHYHPCKISTLTTYLVQLNAVYLQEYQPILQEILHSHDYNHDKECEIEDQKESNGENAYFQFLMIHRQAMSSKHTHHKNKDEEQAFLEKRLVKALLTGLQSQCDLLKDTAVQCTFHSFLSQVEALLEQAHHRSLMNEQITSIESIESTASTAIVGINFKSFQRATQQVFRSMQSLLEYMKQEYGLIYPEKPVKLEIAREIFHFYVKHNGFPKAIEMLGGKSLRDFMKPMSYAAVSSANSGPSSRVSGINTSLGSTSHEEDGSVGEGTSSMGRGNRDVGGCRPSPPSQPQRIVRCHDFKSSSVGGVKQPFSNIKKPSATSHHGNNMNHPNHYGTKNPNARNPSSKLHVSHNQAW